MFDYTLKKFKLTCIQVSYFPDFIYFWRFGPTYQAILFYAFPNSPMILEVSLEFQTFNFSNLLLTPTNR